MSHQFDQQEPFFAHADQQRAADSTVAVAGWYPDPIRGFGERYWDGIGWSQDFTRQGPPAPVVVPGAHYQPQVAGSFGPPQVGADRSQDRSTLLTVGWICSFLAPLIGVIIGCMLKSRGEDRGKWIIITSVLWMAFGVYFLIHTGHFYAYTYTTSGPTAPVGGLQ
ncbi:MAG: DUF2510 domain-containing protein [Thermoleophilaceae bacterium]|nr:DUF2510 domain-containing protein [Thermoleophilaceae bacterium]